MYITIKVCVTITVLKVITTIPRTNAVFINYDTIYYFMLLLLLFRQKKANLLSWYWYSLRR